MAYVRAVGSWFTAGLTGAKYFCVTCLYTSTDNATTLSVQSLYTTPRGSFWLSAKTNGPSLFCVARHGVGKRVRYKLYLL